MTTLGFTAYSPSSSVYAASYVCLGSGDVWCSAIDATLNHNGSAVTGLSSLTVTTTSGASPTMLGTPLVLVAGDKLDLVIASPAGSPKGLAFTMIPAYSGTGDLVLDLAFDVAP